MKELQEHKNDMNYYENQAIDTVKDNRIYGMYKDINIWKCVMK